WRCFRVSGADFITVAGAEARGAAKKPAREEPKLRPPHGRSCRLWKEDAAFGAARLVSLSATLSFPGIEEISARPGAALGLEGVALVQDVADAEGVDRLEEPEPIGDVEPRREVLAEDERGLIQSPRALQGRGFEAVAGGEALGDQVAAFQAQRGG